MKDLAIYCAGGFGRELYCMIFKRIIPALRENNYKSMVNGLNANTQFVGFFDDKVSKGSKLQYGSCLGGIKELNEWPSAIDLVIANGSPKQLKSISQNITNPNVHFPNVIHPSCTFSDEESVSVGIGNIFCIDCHLSCNVKVGNFNVMNGHISMGHEVNIGNYNSFMPDSRISGGVTIGDENLFGAMSFILQGMEIGSYIHLSPGSMLLTKPKDGGTYIGNPAKRLKF